MTHADADSTEVMCGCPDPLTWTWQAPWPWYSTGRPHLVNCTPHRCQLEVRPGRGIFVLSGTCWWRSTSTRPPTAHSSRALIGDVAGPGPVPPTPGVQLPRVQVPAGRGSRAGTVDGGRFGISSRLVVVVVGTGDVGQSPRGRPRVDSDTPTRRTSTRTHSSAVASQASSHTSSRSPPDQGVILPCLRHVSLSG
jgi:hypothetical protein